MRCDLKIFCFTWVTSLPTKHRHAQFILNWGFWNVTCSVALSFWTCQCGGLGVFLPLLRSVYLSGLGSCSSYATASETTVSFSSFFRIILSDYGHTFSQRNFRALFFYISKYSLLLLDLIRYKGYHWIIHLIKKFLCNSKKENQKPFWGKQCYFMTYVSLKKFKKVFGFLLNFFSNKSVIQ